MGEAADTLGKYYSRMYFTHRNRIACIQALTDVQRLYACDSFHQLQFPGVMSIAKPSSGSFSMEDKRHFYRVLNNHFDDFVNMIEFQSLRVNFTSMPTECFLPILTDTIPPSYLSCYESLFIFMFVKPRIFKDFIVCFRNSISRQLDFVEQCISLYTTYSINSTTDKSNFNIPLSYTQIIPSPSIPLDETSSHSVSTDDEVISNESSLDSSPTAPIVPPIVVRTLTPTSTANLKTFTSGCICVPSSYTLSNSSYDISSYASSFDVCHLPLYSHTCVDTSCVTSCSSHVYTCLMHTCIEYFPCIPTSFQASSNFIPCLCFFPSKKFLFYILQCFVNLLGALSHVYLDTALFDFEHILHCFSSDIQTYQYHESIEEMLSHFIYCYSLRSFVLLSIYNIMKIVTCFIRTPSIKLYTDATDTSLYLSCLLYSS